jgi:hypothetical protein
LKSVNYSGAESIEGFGHTNCKCDFDNDKEKLHPEWYPEDPILSEMLSKTLVFPTSENCWYNIAATANRINFGFMIEIKVIYHLHEHREEAVVQSRVALRIKNGEQDESCSTNDGEPNGQTRINLLPYRGVSDEPSLVS